MPRIASFKVVGRGRFPVDMLRHDMAWPRDGVSAEAIFTPDGSVDRGELRTLHLCTARKADPTFARWASFGWIVTECFDDYFNPVQFIS